MNGVFYEIELKSGLLTAGQYSELAQRLAQERPLLADEASFTVRYRKNDTDDYRSRRIDGTNGSRREFVWKDGDSTSISRREFCMPLEENQLRFVERQLQGIGYVPMRPWFKRKRQYQYEHGSFTYLIDLQRIEGYGSLVEVEYLDHKDSSAIHEPNLRAILKELGVTPADPRKIRHGIEKFNE